MPHLLSATHPAQSRRVGPSAALPARYGRGVPSDTQIVAAPGTGGDGLNVRSYAGSCVTVGGMRRPEKTFQATDVARRSREVLDSGRAGAALIRDKDGVV